MGNQLYPTYKSDIGKYLDIELVPSFASYSPDGTGGWNFECQHGPNECNGNLYQVCLLDVLEDKSIQIEAINCILSDRHPYQATEKCMNELMIPDYEGVNECHVSNYGENLLYQNSWETENNLDPHAYFIPWITINDIWNEDEFEGAFKDLRQVLCKNYLNNVPECN